MNLAGAVLGATSKSSGSPVFLIVLIGIVGAVYFFFLRPQQLRQKQQRTQRSQIEVGDEVLTVGGIVGRVVDMSGDRVTIVTGEDAEGESWGGTPTTLVLLRQGIARKVEPLVPAEHGDDDDVHDHDDDAHDHDAHDHDVHDHDVHDHDVHDHDVHDDHDHDDHDDAGDDGPTKGGRGR
jgi:preprotein translocase YajC subunit